MGCCEYNLWMYQRTSTLVDIQLLWVVFHWFFSQDGHHPWKFSKLGLTVIRTCDAEAYAFCIAVATARSHLWCRFYGIRHSLRLLAAHIQVVLTGPILDPARELENAELNDELLNKVIPRELQIFGANTRI